MAKSAAALHILVKEEKLALEILAKLERGVSFDHLAKRYSKEGANKQVISSQADSLIKISRIWAD
ncbi:hypothetical protein MGS85_20765, partial [Klebsiella pneumoniae]|nr:hypothetical protein [Klebsiella pneumoniae]MCW6205409.1 hypothetical protein [Klebsiella pneumoniae]MCW6216589.1 hypothetical protein [Klebsiella pneumoniae]MCW6221819.1 hypothetical protein [Klebsiella pneumoniae]MCW6281857.1 hypothetical protein [Klebsiella pneumoniae]